MKKVIISVIIVLATMISFAQNNEWTSNDNTQKKQNGEAVIYQLFPTQNMWTFIKLNSRNGKMWQVQYDVKDNDRFEVYLNMLPLVNKESEANGRFTLYSTQNIWTFILLDQLDGRMWQVQWSNNANKRALFPIE